MRRYLTQAEAQTIRRLLQEEGRRQDWLGAQLGISKPNLNHMLALRRPAPSDLVEQAARALGVRLVMVQSEPAEKVPA